MTKGDLLVLGASGFLGPHLLRAASRAGWRPSAAVRRELPTSSGARPRILRWEAEHPGALAKLFEQSRPAAVVLAAALARVDACRLDPEHARRLNADLPAATARLCRAHGVRLVHLSTDLVFGGRPPRGSRFDEQDPAAPVHAYGRSKAEGEERVLAEYPGALVVRLPLLYGDSGGRALGATDSILAALRLGTAPELFTDEWRTPLEVGNAAAALIELCEHDLDGRLHVAGPERITRHGLGMVLLESLGHSPGESAARLRSARRADRGLESERPADVSLDAGRAGALLSTALLAPRAALAAALTAARDDSSA